MGFRQTIEGVVQKERFGKRPVIQREIAKNSEREPAAVDAAFNKVAGQPACLKGKPASDVHAPSRVCIAPRPCCLAGGVRGSDRKCIGFE